MSKMVDNTSEKDKVKKAPRLFTDKMVEDLLKVLRDTKLDMKGKSLDFEGDLLKLNADVK